ncbi:MAG: hypothetical protein A2033_09900 [Bacteroidetes bacterium GWA2_31_9]|nr:MAG: hypothetical protein A2033_09900 [Bacteroidetes bacterium GWA2_31_9]
MSDDIDITELLESNDEDETEILDDEIISDEISITDSSTIHVAYNEMSKEELLETLTKLLETDNIMTIKTDIENIRAIFYKKHRQENESKKQLLIDQGEEVEGFDFTDETEVKFKDVYKQFKDARFNHLKKFETEKEDNLLKKNALIDEIKNLVNKEESLNKTFQDFREIQKKWKEIGPVPQSELINLWESYNHQVEVFYSYVNINKELRDLDFKKNLELKVELCEKTEELLLESSVRKAAELLQDYHTKWREIGPVMLEQKEEIWQRFKEATTKINKKHQDYYLNLKEEQEQNLIAKEAICTEIESISENKFDSPKKWSDITNRIIELQNLWRTIGYAPKKQNQKIFDRFRAACNIFFNRKKEFFNALKEQNNINLQKKIDICLIAESLKESTDWKETANELIKLQREWKNTGHVTKKQSDDIWKRFRTACDYFFNKKDDYFKNLEQNLESNLELKKALISAVNGYIPVENVKDNLDKLKEFQKEWTNIGHVPFKVKDSIQNEFRQAINKQFDKLNIDKKKKETFFFKQHIDNLKEKPQLNKYKISDERERIIKNMKQLEADIALLENNIGFFSKSKNADKFIEEFKVKIEQNKKQLALMQEQIKIIDNV